MTPEQVRTILTTICEQWAGKEEQAPNICIMHGDNTVAIYATYPAWEIEGDILHVSILDGSRVRWITCDSIHSICI
jgi:hypothetical protein